MAQKVGKLGFIVLQPDDCKWLCAPQRGGGYIISTHEVPNLRLLLTNAATCQLIRFLLSLDHLLTGVGRTGEQSA